MRYSFSFIFTVVPLMYSMSQTESKSIVNVNGDVVELRISVYNYLSGADTTYLHYLKEGEQNILTRYGSISDHSKLRYTFNIDTQEHHEELIPVGETLSSEFDSGKTKLSQKVNLLDHTIKNSRGLDSIQCWDSNCWNKITYSYHKNLKQKEVIQESDGQNHGVKYKKIVRFDTLGNKLYESNVTNDKLSSEFISYYVEGTSLIASIYCVDYFFPKGKIDTINFAYIFDKNNWISRKRFVNGELVEEVSRRIFYTSDVKNLISQNYFKPYFDCYTHDNIEMDLNEYILKYDCHTNRINCFLKSGKIKWSINTEKVTDSYVVDVRRSFEEKYDVEVFFADKSIIELNSKNGRLKR